jgi:transcriptional regulator with XRE-family HTH domain
VKLTGSEQRHVRTAIRFMRYKVGGWQAVAEALGMKADTISKVLRGARDVTANLAYSVARLTDVSIDELLSGALLSPQTCPHCGRPPDFADEVTVVEDQPREAVLKLVR